MKKRSMWVRWGIAGFIGGSILGASWLALSSSWQLWLVAALILTIGGWWFARATALKAIYIVIAGLCLGIGWVGLYDHWLLPNADFYKPYDSEGIIVSEPVQKPTYQQLIVKTDAGRRVLVKAETYPLYHYGDVLNVKGEIEKIEKFETDNGKMFDYPMYLAMRYRAVGLIDRPEVRLVDSGKGNILVTQILKLKKTLTRAIETTLPEPQSTLAEGLLIGGSGGFTDNFKLAMQRTGTSHIVAISGYNVTIVIMVFFFAVRRRLGYRAAIISGFAALLLFVIITGASASVVRAGIMGSLFLFAKLVGRQNRIDYTVYLAAFFMTALNPLIARYDAGFQLSFLAVLGLVYFSAPIGGWLEHHIKWFKHIPIILRETLVATISAQLMTWPLLVALFGQVSLIAPIVNMLILPIVPWAMLLCFAVMLAAIIWPLLGQTLSLFAWLPLTYIIEIIQKTGDLPHVALAQNNINWWWLAGWLLVLALIWLRGLRRPKQKVELEYYKF